MRISTVALMAGLLAASCGVAQAALPNGNEVSVTPVTGGGTLYYPGGQYMRVIQPLLAPGQSAKDSGAIQLHMPAKRPRVRRDVVAVPAQPAAPKIAAAPKPQPQRAAAAAPTPPAAAAPSFGAGAAGIDLGPAPRQMVAKAEPPPATTASTGASLPGMNKHTVILFAAGASDPAQGALSAIKFLAGDLNNSMTGPGSRVQLLAYGGDKGDKGSEARRLSLKRALAIRQVLIDDGVPSERIDVRAMGGADDGGPADRVDVYVKS